MIMEDSEIQKAGDKVVTGLRDNLLKPMHNSLAAQMKAQHESLMLAVTKELPHSLLQSLADSFRSVRWDDDESK